MERVRLIFAVLWIFSVSVTGCIDPIPASEDDYQDNAPPSLSEVALLLSSLEMGGDHLEEVQKTVEQVAAKAAAAVIREEIAALAEEL